MKFSISNTILKGHAQSVYALCQGNSSKTFFSGGADKIVAKWNLHSGKPEGFSIKTTDVVYALNQFYPKNMLFIGLANGHLHVIDLVKKQEIRNLSINQKGIFSIAVFEENNHLITTGGDGTVCFFNLENLILIKQYKLAEFKIRNVAFSKNLNQYAFGLSNGEICLINSNTLQIISVFKAHNQAVNAVALYPDKKWLVSGGKDAHLNFWDISSTQSNTLLKKIPAHNYAIYQVAFNSNANILATASRDKTIKLWNTETFEIIERLDFKKYNGHKYSVNNLMWHHATNQLITCSDDKQIIVWNIK